MNYIYTLFTLLIITSFAPAQETHIRINQYGYLSKDAKSALIFSNRKIKENFKVESGTGDFVKVFKPEKVESATWGKFKYYYELDFTEIEEPGVYFIQGQRTKAKSKKFQISAHTFKGTTSDLLTFMRQQRCGYNPMLDRVCHQRDGRTFYGTIQDSSYVDVSGGWHDAGDQLKYLITGSYATAHMLMAYKLFPQPFEDLVNTLGQLVPNGIPDILDEARWGLDWIMKMHVSESQLIHQVADDRDHRGWKWPYEDNSDYGWGPNSYRPAYVANGKPQGLREFKSEATGLANLAGRSAAALALGAQAWKELDPAFSAKCLQKARQLYQLGKLNEGFQQGNSFGAPYRYGEITWADDMEWGASELFRLTGENQYLEEAKKYALMANTDNWLMQDSAAHYQYYPFINLGHFSLYDQVDDEFKSRLAGYYRSEIEIVIQRANTNPFGIGVPFIWCSNNLLTSFVTQILLYEKMTGDDQFHVQMLNHLDWLFGRNPWGTSMFTGMPRHGEYPEDVHTSIWALTKIMVPGGLIDGPIYQTIHNNLKGLTLYQEDEFSHLQNSRIVYHDDIGDYSTNEPTMDGTAGAMIMMAAIEGSQMNK